MFFSSICIPLHILGSPPRMRGTVVEEKMVKAFRRITPAHAGNRSLLQEVMLRLRDHPRACGEQFASFRSRSAMSGSPPRMRGTEDANGNRQADFRITPAHAGNRHFPSVDVIAPQDHPRACGEQRVRTTGPLATWGSPPRMRGTVAEIVIDQPFDGITPAHAGNRICTTKA